jgi:hypothetical protein
MLLRGGEIGISIEKPAAEEPKSKPEPPPATPMAEPSVPPPGPPLFRLEIGIGYVVGAFGDDPPVIHGLELGLGLAHRSGVFGALGYRLVGPLEAKGEQAEIEIRRHPLRLTLGYLHRLERVSLGGSLAANFDYATEETRALASAEVEPVDHGDFVFSLEPTLLLRVWLGPRIALSLGLGAEIVFNRINYREQGPDGPTVIASPWLFQPRGGIGIVVVPI